ncbi:MAG: VCBS repeat-containing protein [Planctomycetes bacterium]|nr:VCBS repeat-containing protein [Planctomycetota bacterium]
MSRRPLDTAIFAGALLLAPATAQIDTISFSRGQLLDVGASIVRSELCDLNGDGDPDLLASAIPTQLVMQLGNRGAAFTEPAQTLPATSGPHFVCGDLDGDGDLDLVAAGSRLQVLINDGTGRFALGASLPFFFRSAHPVIGDFDGDGLGDLAQLEIAATQRIHIHFGDPSGAFLQESTLGLPLGIMDLAPMSLRRGAPPVVLAAYSDGTILGIATTPATRALNSTTLISAPSFALRSIEQVVDATGDGNADLVVLASTGQLSPMSYAVLLFLGDGSTGFLGTQVPLVSPRALSAARCADFDRSGRLDVAALMSDRLAIQRFGSSTVYQEFDLDETSLHAPAFADLDDDGDQDLVVATGGRLRVHQNRVRAEFHFAFDEATGNRAYDSAQGTEAASSLSISSPARWQGDPGPGRQAYRGNDAGTGMLARGSGAHASSLAISSAPGSCSFAWWQRMGPNAPQRPLGLLSSSMLTVSIGAAPTPDRLTITTGLPFVASTTYTSALPIATPNLWRHLAITYDASSQQIQLFVDGLPDGPPAPASALFDGALRQPIFGSAGPGWPLASEAFDLDELRYLPRQLGAAEIRALSRGDGIALSPMGDGCFERRLDEGLLASLGAVPGGLVDLRLETTGLSNGAALLAFGTSNTQLGGLSLPLDFGFGCVLRTSLEVLVPMPSGQVAELALRLPSMPGILQGHLYVQGVVLAAGVQTTRAFDLKLRY